MGHVTPEIRDSFFGSPRHTGDSRFGLPRHSEIRGKEKKKDNLKQAKEAIAVIVPRSPMNAPMPTGRDGTCRVSPVSSRRRARARRFRAKRNHEFEEAKNISVEPLILVLCVFSRSVSLSRAPERSPWGPRRPSESLSWSPVRESAHVFHRTVLCRTELSTAPSAMRRIS